MSKCEAVHQDVVGIWVLQAFEGEDQRTGTRAPMFGAASSGRLILTNEGIMMGMITAIGRPLPLTDDDRVRSFNTMIGYSGRYKLEDDKFITSVDLSWNEAWVGSLQVRNFTVSNSRLEIVTDWGVNPFNQEQIWRGILEWCREY